MESKMLPQLVLDEISTVDQLTTFLRHYAKDTGFSRAVLGLSGGVDSALSASLAARAFSPENVLCIMMPYGSTHTENLKHAQNHIHSLGVHSEIIDIETMVNSVISTDSEMNQIRRGNIMARMRMIILYDRSARDHALVIGTGNKTEALLGYSTVYGDSACALNPLGDLYKTQVWQLARYLGVSDEIVNKAPSADLWEGQTDELELGFTYSQADALLYYLIDEKQNEQELEKSGFDLALIKRITTLIAYSQFKRVLPPVGILDRSSVDKRESC